MIEMSSAQEKLLAKHPPLSPGEVYKKEVDRDEAIKKYKEDISKAEENLVNFLNKEDPLIDPATNTAIAWLRRLPISEIEGLVPQDLTDAYEEGDKEAFKKAAKERKSFIYNMMEKFISKPHKTADEWKGCVNSQFAELFMARIEELNFRTDEQMSFL